MKKKPYNNIDIVITGNVAWCDDLSWDEKILYGIIRGLTKNDYYCCYASNEYLCEKLQKSNDSTVRRYLRKLENLGFIRRGYAYITDDFGEIYRARAIIPTELAKQFEKVQNIMEDLKKSSKKCPKTVQKCTGKPCNPARLIINKEYPCKKSSLSTNIKAEYNPQTPLQGGEQADTLVEPEQFELVGKGKNVRLSESQRVALSGEFGADLASSLIEQLSAWIASGVKRLRKNTDHYAMLRDWGLRRTQPKHEAPARILIGGRDMERREYSQKELDLLFNALDDIPDDD